jgi:hypothetical protein
MRRFFLLATVVAPLGVFAQASFPTEFPGDSAPVDAAALKQLLSGKTFVGKPSSGSEFRVQYKDSHAFLNVGSVSDSGPWRTEGSSVCNDWRTVRPSCSEMRVSGKTLYVKRANNGEIIRLQEQ